MGFSACFQSMAKLLLPKVAKVNDSNVKKVKKHITDYTRINYKNT